MATCSWPNKFQIRIFQLIWSITSRRLVTVKQRPTWDWSMSRKRPQKPLVGISWKPRQGISWRWYIYLVRFDFDLVYAGDALCRFLHLLCYPVWRPQYSLHPSEVPGLSQVCVTSLLLFLRSPEVEFKEKFSSKAWFVIETCFKKAGYEACLRTDFFLDIFLYHEHTVEFQNMVFICDGLEFHKTKCTCLFMMCWCIV